MVPQPKNTLESSDPRAKGTKQRGGASDVSAKLMEEDTGLLALWLVIRDRLETNG